MLEIGDRVAYAPDNKYTGTVVEIKDHTVKVKWNHHHGDVAHWHNIRYLTRLEAMEWTE